MKLKLRKCHGCKVRYDCKYGWDKDVCSRCELGYFCGKFSCKHYEGKDKCYFEKRVHKWF